MLNVILVLHSRCNMPDFRLLLSVFSQEKHFCEKAGVPVFSQKNHFSIIDLRFIRPEIKGFLSLKFIATPSINTQAKSRAAETGWHQNGLMELNHFVCCSDF